MSDGFFVADLPAGLAAGGQVWLTGREAHHAAVVRRLRLGETVTLTDGLGRGVSGTVAGLDPRQVEVTVTEVLHQAPRRPLVTVVQALPKNDRAELAVDLMTEVGVDRIVPWQAARSIVKWSPDKVETARQKWLTAAREASKQARRLSFPVIGELATTGQVADLIIDSPMSLVMHERATTPLADCPVAQAEECLIVIGPEGGLTDQEVGLFTSCGALACSLGPTVLRTSTAGAVAVTQTRLLFEVARTGGDRPT